MMKAVRLGRIQGLSLMRWREKSPCFVVIFVCF